MMDSLELMLGAKVSWVADRLRIQDVQPRHLGRPVSFDYLYPDKILEDYDTDRVLGILEGVAGSVWLVSGVEYDDDRIESMKIHRPKIGA